MKSKLGEVGTEITRGGKLDVGLQTHINIY